MREVVDDEVNVLMFKSTALRNPSLARNERRVGYDERELKFLTSAL